MHCVVLIQSIFGQVIYGFRSSRFTLASCSCCGWLYFLPLLLSFLFSITKIIHILSRSSIQFHYPVIYEGWYFTHMRKTLA